MCTQNAHTHISNASGFKNSVGSRLSMSVKNTVFTRFATASRLWDAESQGLSDNLLVCKEGGDELCGGCGNGAKTSSCYLLLHQRVEHGPQEGNNGRRMRIIGG